MYSLILVGYIVLGAAQGGGYSGPSQMVVGNFTDEKSCRDAMVEFDKAKSFRDVTNNMSEYKWGFMCVPSGFSKGR